MCGQAQAYSLLEAIVLCAQPLLEHSFILVMIGLTHLTPNRPNARRLADRHRFNRRLFGLELHYFPLVVISLSGKLPHLVSTLPSMTGPTPFAQ